MYLAPDRPDCQFGIRELTKGLKEPKVGDMQALVRLTRYLIKTEGYGVTFKPEENPQYLDCYSDTDWGNCKKTRKSTACGVFKVGNCTLASYCRGLAMICLSSGEAEFNGGVGCCSEGLFYHQLLGFMGFNTKMRVYLDSSAARGVFQRQGAGRVRHLEIKSLWVQQALRQKKFSLHAVNIHENVADVGTKALAVAKLEKFREELGVIPEETFQEETKEFHTGGVVAAIGKLQTAVKVMTALGLVQPVAAQAEEKLSEEGKDWMMFAVMFCVIWTIMSMTWMLVKSVKGWVYSREDVQKKPRGRKTEDGKKSQRAKGEEKCSETEEENSQRAGSEARASQRSYETEEGNSQRAGKGQGSQQQNLRLRGAATGSESVWSEDDISQRSSTETVMLGEASNDIYAYEKKEGLERIYDKCYPFCGTEPPKFYKSKSGECVHMDARCHGLRNRKTAVETLRVQFSLLSSRLDELCEQLLQPYRGEVLEIKDASGPADVFVCPTELGIEQPKESTGDASFRLSLTTCSSNGSGRPPDTPESCEPRPSHPEPPNHRAGSLPRAKWL
eukprot:s961_g9.t1